MGDNRGGDPRTSTSDDPCPDDPGPTIGRAELVRSDDVGRIGISCSGGGLRSAAFNLGALQSLDEAGMLRRADHLSAVSGGAYIASAFAVANRYSDPALLRKRPAYAPGTPEERWVRNHCSYLTNGFADTLRIVGVAVVGLLANVVFFLALLWAVARPLGWFYAWWQPGLRPDTWCMSGLAAAAGGEANCTEQLRGPAKLQGIDTAAWVAAGLAAAGLAGSLFVRMFRLRWPLRQVVRNVAVALLAAGALVAVVAIVLPELVEFTRNVLGGQRNVEGSAPEGPGASRTESNQTLRTIATVGGAATLAALVIQIGGIMRRAAVTGGQVATRVRGVLGRFTGGLRRVANLVLGAVVGPLALAAGGLLILNAGVQGARPTGPEVAWWAAMVGLTVAMTSWGDVTTWSLHPFYKWRLSRTFGAVRAQRKDVEEGVATHPPYEEPLLLSRLSAASFSKAGLDPFPELLVCASVNVSDPGATPPGRTGLPFVFSPERIGTPGVVAVPTTSWWQRFVDPNAELTTEIVDGLEAETAAYEKRFTGRRERDVTLPAAVAISGAAVAPSMGKMTRAPLRFLLALTNVRLGVWLPRPGTSRHDGEGRGGIGRRVTRPGRGDRPKQLRLLFEVVGRHRLKSRFVYVTDGGHIENLGLVELLRRRCSTIVCLDAAGGSTDSFSTLGEAIALAASELDVRVDIDPSAGMAPVEGVSRLNAANVVTGTIRYPEPDVPDGLLIYGKALVAPGSPWDVRAYAAKDPQFPATPTGDQLFSGETFDAYQALGREVGAACARLVPPDVDLSRRRRVDAAAGPTGPRPPDRESRPAAT